MERDNIDLYFMKMAYLISSRSTCLRRKVGCAIVKDKILISAGYNGVPINLPHCEECLRKQMNILPGEKYEFCKACHAEQNAIISAAKNGVSINNSILYCTTKPCITCIKMIVNSGIKKIVFNEYHQKNIDDLYKFIIQNVIMEKIDMETGNTIQVFN